MPVRILSLPFRRRRRSPLAVLALGWLGPATIGLAPVDVLAQEGIQPIPTVDPSAAGAPAAPVAAPAAPVAAPAALVPGPAAQFATAEQFAQVLEQGSLDQLQLACQEATQFNQMERLRQLRVRLLNRYPAPQPLPVVLANADVLLSCQAPVAAQEVLDRYGPAPGSERLQWLLLQWRAAAAALDHRRAVIALGRLVQLEALDLERTALPVRRQDDGTVVSRPALDLLIDHWVALGRPAEAARLASSSAASGEVVARRLQQAAALQPDLPLAERNRLLESALEQAAAAGAWGLVAELLDAQVALQREPGGNPRQAIERRLRLSGPMDDAYGEWVLRRQLAGSTDGEPGQRLRALETQLRSPRSPGGHAADAPRPVPVPQP